MMLAMPLLPSVVTLSKGGFFLVVGIFFFIAAFGAIVYFGEL
jgi:hypothetical protein